MARHTIESTPSPQELRVIQRLWLGETDKEIAAALRLSPVTVHHYLGSCYLKFQVPNRLALIRRALEARWIAL